LNASALPQNVVSKADELSDPKRTAAATATPPKENVRTNDCSKNHHADSNRHIVFPVFYLMAKLASTLAVVNISVGVDIAALHQTFTVHL